MKNRNSSAQNQSCAALLAIAKSGRVADLLYHEFISGITFYYMTLYDRVEMMVVDRVMYCMAPFDLENGFKPTSMILMQWKIYVCNLYVHGSSKTAQYLGYLV